MSTTQRALLSFGPPSGGEAMGTRDGPSRPPVLPRGSTSAVIGCWSDLPTSALGTDHWARRVVGVPTSGEAALAFETQRDCFNGERAEPILWRRPSEGLCRLLPSCGPRVIAEPRPERTPSVQARTLRTPIDRQSTSGGTAGAAPLSIAPPTPPHPRVPAAPGCRPCPAGSTPCGHRHRVPAAPRCQADPPAATRQGTQTQFSRTTHWKTPAQLGSFRVWRSLLLPNFYRPSPLSRRTRMREPGEGRVEEMSPQSKELPSQRPSALHP